MQNIFISYISLNSDILSKTLSTYLWKNASRVTAAYFIYHVYRRTDHYNHYYHYVYIILRHNFTSCFILRNIKRSSTYFTYFISSILLILYCLSIVKPICGPKFQEKDSRSRFNAFVKNWVLLDNWVLLQSDVFCVFTR